MAFADRIAKYTTAKAEAPKAEVAQPAAQAVPAPATVVPVNPPESAKVLEEKTAPEMAGQPEPKEPEPEKKGRGKGKAAKAADAAPAPYAEGNSLADAILLVKGLLPAGVSVTIAGG